MFVCDHCGKNSEVKNSCPNCGAIFCSSCIDAIKQKDNQCPKCGTTPDAALRRKADTSTRGDSI